MAVIRGMDCKLYISDDDTTWSEVANAQSATLNLSTDSFEANVRGNNGFKTYVATLKDGSVDFTLLAVTGDAVFTIVRTAWQDGTPLFVEALDGGRAVVGSKGVKGPYTVSNFTRTENLTEAVVYQVNLQPTVSGASTVDWYEVPE